MTKLIHLAIAASVIAAAQGTDKEKPAANTASPTTAQNVTVVNPATAPAYTRNADIANRRPFLLFRSGNFGSANTIYYGTVQVPNTTGKMFVIESFRAWMGMVGTDIMMNCYVEIFPTAAVGSLPAFAQQEFKAPAIFSGYDSNSQNTNYTINSPAQLFLPPGANANVSCLRGGPNFSAPTGDGTLESIYWNLSGYLMDVPQ